MGTQPVTRVVLDTNVVVSALLFGGTPGRLVELWQTGRIRPVVSAAIADEYLRVLAYPRFALSREEIHFLFYDQILPYFEPTVPQSGPPINEEDPTDDMFLCCACGANAEAVISGDRHLLKVKIFRSIPILTVARFLRK